MKVYFITRFSILDHKKGVWELSTLNNKEYEKQLFSTERLDAKFVAFEKMTLPSIINQTSPNYEWLIMGSNFLPEKYKDRLKKLVKSYPKIKLFLIKDFTEFYNILGKYPFGKNYATVRLDDDDGLNKDYVQILQKYKDNDKHIISFPHGHKYKIENNKIITREKNIYVRDLALGLCAINMNIHKCGDHRKIGEKYKVIYDETKNIYNLLCSPYCDTKRVFP